MNSSTVRAILAILIVGIFMLLSAFLVIYPIVTNQQVQLAEFADYFMKTAGVYTGIIGVIIGYYFSRAQDIFNKKDNKKNSK